MTGKKPILSEAVQSGTASAEELAKDSLRCLPRQV